MRHESVAATSVKESTLWVICSRIQSKCTCNVTVQSKCTVTFFIKKAPRVDFYFQNVKPVMEESALFIHSTWESAGVAECGKEAKFVLQMIRGEGKYFLMTMSTVCLKFFDTYHFPLRTLAKRRNDVRRRCEDFPCLQMRASETTRHHLVSRMRGLWRKTGLKCNRVHLGLGFLEY